MQIMRHFLPKLQISGVVIVMALLCAKFPAFAEHDDSVSLYGGLFGALASAFAIFIASLFSKPIRNFESSESISRLLPMRVATVALAIAMTGITAYLYLKFDWLLTIVRLAVIVGVIAGFAGMVMGWKARQN
jgi:hypothetical protein